RASWSEGDAVSAVDLSLQARISLRLVNSTYDEVQALDDSLLSDPVQDLDLQGVGAGLDVRQVERYPQRNRVDVLIRREDVDRGREFLLGDIPLANLPPDLKLRFPRFLPAPGMIDEAGGLDRRVAREDPGRRRNDQRCISGRGGLEIDAASRG